MKASLTALSIVSAVAFSPPVHALTYSVTNPNDAGGGSLRAAINQANSNPGADIIEVQLPNRLPIFALSPLYITDEVYIQFNGFAMVVNQSTWLGGNSLFEISAASGNACNPASPVMVTFTNGQIDAARAPNTSFRAVNVASNCHLVTGNLTISNFAAVSLPGTVHLEDGAIGQFFSTTFMNNQASAGGAVKAGNASIVVFEANSALRGNQADVGGGIRAEASAILLAHSTSFEGNIATAGSGGAISTEASGSMGLIEIANSSFFSNQAHNAGGAVSVVGADSLSIVAGDVFNDNQGQGVGGAVSASLVNNIEINAAIFENNRAGSDGGGLHLNLRPGSLTTISEASFLNNFAPDFGGGLYTRVDGGGTADVRMENSTVSMNIAIQSGQSIYVREGQFTCSFCTVADGLAPSAIADIDRLNGSLSFMNSVLFRSSSLPPGKICRTSVGAAPYTIASDLSCSLSGPGSLQGVATNMAPLNAPGGQSPAHAPLGSSPALFRVPASACLPIDQRGSPRPAGGPGFNCTSGAIETP